MAPKLNQSKRIASLTTPLGDNVLVVTRFDGGEGVSELFEYRIEALSEEDNLDFDQAIGQHCTLTFRTYNRGQRLFDGILVEAQWLGVQDAYYAYRIVLKPWLWFLSRTTDCRSFANLSAPDIIKKVFEDDNCPDHHLRLTESYPTLEYTVQYRETDLAFVSRLMERNGIYYFFEHEEGKHTMVLADSVSKLERIKGQAFVPFLPLTDSDQRNSELIYRMSTERRFRTGRVALNDYDCLQPNAQLLSDANGDAGYTRADMEHYDYPGNYTDRDEGARLAKVRLDAEQALDNRRHAAGDAISLYPGGLFKLVKHPKDAENVEYIIIRCSHSFVAESYRTGDEEEAGEIYFGNYELLASDKTFRAPLLTPRPLIHGPQTAVVVGKKGEEIDVDEHGRIYVRFFWDRDKNQSLPIRVAQVWSGKTWGGIYIPRIDQEVVVVFLEGDPDRPLIVGTVYNGQNEVPWELPANKTIAGIKSDSSKGGGGYNQLSFEDMQGSEKIELHAEKDLDIVVKNVETRRIDGEEGNPSRDTTLTAGDDALDVQSGSQKVHIAANQEITVDQSITISAGIQIVLKVGSSNITIDGSGVSITGVGQISADAPMTKVNGSAILTLTGGLVKIN